MTIVFCIEIDETMAASLEGAAVVDALTIIDEASQLQLPAIFRRVSAVRSIYYGGVVSVTEFATDEFLDLEYWITDLAGDAPVEAFRDYVEVKVGGVWRISASVSVAPQRDEELYLVAGLFRGERVFRLTDSVTSNASDAATVALNAGDKVGIKCHEGYLGSADFRYSLNMEYLG